MDPALLEKRLAREKRARAAAEQLLEQKAAELYEANQKLARHAETLSQENREVRSKAEELKGQADRVRSDLERANLATFRAERRLWGAVEAISDGFAIFDSDDLLVAANRAFAKAFGPSLELVQPGFSYDAVLNTLIANGFFDTEGQDEVAYKATILKRRAGGEAHVARLSDGEYIKILHQFTPDGDMVCLAQNITDMMRMWAAVEEIPDGFVLYDREDRLVMCNQRYRDIYAASAPAMRPGNRFEDILRYGLSRGQYADGIGREEEWLAERLSKHRVAEEVLEQPLGDGRWLRVLEKATPDGGRVGLRVDITQMKRHEEVLETARVDAEAANRAKSAFLANMSHEIRTPMNGVVGMADLLMETSLTEDQRLYAETIRNSGEALLVIINDLLDYSKIEAEKLELFPEPFDLERSIHEVVMLLHSKVADKPVDIAVDYDMFMPTRLVGDAGRLRQILVNLVGNAIKFTAEGFVLIRVTGVAKDDGTQEVHVAVEDSGIGIPADKLDHVFGEFNQVEDQANRNFEGTGLGLAITRRLVDLMGGEVWVESEMGEGSCFGFRINLPIAETDAACAGPPSIRLTRALVVDDQKINRVILKKQLGQIGLSVTTVGSAAEALQALGPGDGPARYDMILTDHMMPGQDGVELARTLRARGSDVPVLLLSSVQELSRQDRDDNLFVAVLQKPVLRGELLRAIGAIGAAPDAGAASPPPRPTAAPGTACAAPVALAAGGIRLLAAEDNRTNQLVLSRMVRGLDVDLTIVADGREAVEAYRADPPDLIFMDISMPVMDGIEATALIREAEAEAGAPRVPIVALTAHAMTGDEKRFLDAGMDHYLTKPLKRAAIAALLTEIFPASCPMPSRAATDPLSGRAAG